MDIISIITQKAIESSSYFIAIVIFVSIFKKYAMPWIDKQIEKRMEIKKQEIDTERFKIAVQQKMVEALNRTTTFGVSKIAGRSIDVALRDPTIIALLKDHLSVLPAIYRLLMGKFHGNTNAFILFLLKQAEEYTATIEKPEQDQNLEEIKKQIEQADKDFAKIAFEELLEQQKELEEAIEITEKMEPIPPEPSGTQTIIPKADSPTPLPKVVDVFPEIAEEPEAIEKQETPPKEQEEPKEEKSPPRS